MNRCLQQASRNVREQGWLQGKGGAAVALEQQDAPGLIAGSAGGHRVMVSCHGAVPIRSFPDLGTKVHAVRDLTLKCTWRRSLGGRGKLKRVGMSSSWRGSRFFTPFSSPKLASKQ